MQVKAERQEKHEKRARMYAEKKEWNIVEVYQLNALNGTAVMDQLETKRMIFDIRNKKMDDLIFSKLTA